MQNYVQIGKEKKTCAVRTTWQQISVSSGYALATKQVPKDYVNWYWPNDVCQAEGPLGPNKLIVSLPILYPGTLFGC